MHFSSTVLVITFLVSLPTGLFGQQQNGPTCPTGDGYDAEVLILGAGMTGISAANTLTKNGVKDFLVIEARDRIGGRIRSEVFNGTRVELGANWIHGLKESNPTSNPIWPIAQRCGLRGNISDFDNIPVYNNSEVVNSTDVERAGVSFEQVLNKLSILGKERKDRNESDISIEEALRLVNSTLVSNDLLMQYFSWFTFQFDYTMPLTNISLFDFVISNAKLGDNYLVTDQRGYEYLLHCFASEFNFNTSTASPDKRLLLNTRVTQINWSSECVCVDTSNGASYCGRKAISTFSIGVLQADASVLKFNPSLPEKKIEAINQLANGLFLKIFVKLNVSLFSSELNGRLDNIIGRFRLIIKLDNFKGKFADFPKDSKILLVILTSRMAHQFVRNSNDSRKDQIVEILQETFPNTSFELEDMLVPDWLDNPLYLGAYSSYQPGVTEKTLEELAVPIGQLYLSGEFMIADARSTVHGAYIAGNRTATAVSSSSSTGNTSVGKFIMALVIVLLALCFM